VTVPEHPRASADVVVVGAGPAGAAAAREAALAGADVLLLERAELPRYKTCGGGLIGASQALLGGMLGPGLAALERDRTTAVSVTRSGRGATRRAPGAAPLLTLVDRADLDSALVDEAVARGVRLRTRAVVTGLVPDASGVTVRLRGSSEVRARVVVGADGSGGRCAAAVGVTARQVDLGLEAEVPVPDGVGRRWRGRVLLDLGVLPGGYGWVFPKGDRLTVGVIGARGDSGALRPAYRALLARVGLDGFPPAVDSGHLTRVRDRFSPLRRGPVLVAGDAAALLEPWTREGISFALRSGRTAGRVAAAAAAAAAGPGREAELRRYEAEIERELGPEIEAGARLLRVFTRRPAVFAAGLSTAPGFDLFTRLVAGDTTLAEQLGRRRVRLPVSVLER
jgi:geranylgeranyl reductase family protein